jgi:arsenate reductase-like glutaredoxin family protein
MPITIYGIKNCDTMKKARAWLDKHGVGDVPRVLNAGRAQRR